MNYNKIYLKNKQKTQQMKLHQVNAEHQLYVPLNAQKCKF